MEQVSAAVKIKKFAGAIRNNRANDSRSVQTVILHDESVYLAIPQLLSNLSNEKSHLIHVLTFGGGDKTAVVQKLQSLLQILNRNKLVRVLCLNSGQIEDQEIENFAETLKNLLSRLNFTFDLQVARLGSDRLTTNQQIHDIDANESNEFISIRIAELFQSEGFPSVTEFPMAVDEKQSEDLHSLDCVERAEFCPESQEIVVNGDDCEDQRSERIVDAYEFIIVLIILFFLFNFIFHLFSNCYVIFKYFK